VPGRHTIGAVTAPDPDRRAPTWALTLAFVVAIYVAAQMLADITSLRILEIGGFSVDGGTLIYPLTFTIRDLIHKVGGVRAARLAIFTAAGINLAMVGLFWLVGVLPPDLAVGPQEGFADLLSPVARIVLASIVAEVVSELLDTEAYRRWVLAFGERYQWGRVLVSNAVAIPVDSAIFVGIAFVGVVPGAVAISIFWANVIVKGAVSLASVPLIYTVRPGPDFRVPEEV
jgi:uncharacterized integral membrane protein (TIGR00697 family)